MSEPATTEIVDFDAEAAVAAARKATEGPLYSLVEFNFEGFNYLYVAEETRALYSSESEMEEHFHRIHSYVNIDFTEIELFTEDLFPMADQVRYKTTALDVMTLVRLYVTENSGVFIALDRGEEVEPVVEAIEQTVYQ